MAPHDVEEGSCVVFWGSDRFTIRQFEKFRGEIRADPFKMFATLIHGIDAEARISSKTGLTYALDGRFSGVVLPHKSSTPLMRLRPFSLPEYLVRAGGPDFLPLLEDEEIHGLQITARVLIRARPLTIAASQSVL